MYEIGQLSLNVPRIKLLNHTEGLAELAHNFRPFLLYFLWVILPLRLRRNLIKMGQGMLIHLVHIHVLTITDSGLVSRHVCHGLFRILIRFLLEKVHELIKHAFVFNILYFFFFLHFLQIWLRQAEQLVDVLLQPFFVTQ